MKTLRTVTDRFSLVEKVRRHTPQNERNYIMQSVRATINDPEVKEHMALGQMFGYYGHGRRAMHYAKTGKLNLPEICVVMVDGKPVTLDNVPASRTVAISLDDDGVVSHTQEILSTEPGNIVSGMLDSNAGGWSWVTGGDDKPTRSIVDSFHGFDYVTTPNYISLDHKSMMMESATDRSDAMHLALRNAGYSDNAATDICHHFETMRDSQAMFEAVERSNHLESQNWAMQGRLLEMQERLTNANMMLESNGEAAKKRRKVMREALADMPVFLSKEQRHALTNMETEDDARIVAAIMESVGGNLSSTLPLGGKKTPEVIAPQRLGAASDDDVLWLTPRR